jgi:hypothetical protein
MAHTHLVDSLLGAIQVKMRAALAASPPPFETNVEIIPELVCAQFDLDQKARRFFQEV